MIVVDPPDRGPRLYERDWNASFWRGSFGEIVRAVEAAQDELNRQGTRHLIATSTLDYKDGSSESFNSFKSFREATQSLDPLEIGALTVHLDGPPSVLIHGTASHGLSVSAKGSEAFAVGMVATLKSRLAGGAEAGEKAGELPTRPIERFFFGLSPLILVVTLVFLFSTVGSPDLVVVIGNIFLAVLLALIPMVIAGGLSADNQARNGPPRFTLVSEGEQFPDEEAPTGPIWAKKRWFENHPALGWLATLVAGGVIGVAITKAGELL